MLTKFNTEEKILELLFKYPTTGFTLREISRRIKISTPMISRIIKVLEKKEIVKVKREKNVFKVYGNTENEKFRELKRIYNLFSLIELKYFLIREFNPSLICVYGSYAFGEDIENSDIDIFVETEKSHYPDLSKFERKLSRKIHLMVGSFSSLPKELKENILTGVVLYGCVRL